MAHPRSITAKRSSTWPRLAVIPGRSTHVVTPVEALPGAEGSRGAWSGRSRRVRRLDGQQPLTSRYVFGAPEVLKDHSLIVRCGLVRTRSPVQPPGASERNPVRASSALSVLGRWSVGYPPAMRRLMVILPIHPRLRHRVIVAPIAHGNRSFRSFACV